MTDHDPMCAINTGVPGDACDCNLIAKVRADERERVHVTSTGLSGRTDYAQVRSEVLADLRAKVESLPHDDGCAIEDAGANGWCTCLRGTVLDLIDGEVDQ